MAASSTPVVRPSTRKPFSRVARRLATPLLASAMFLQACAAGPSTSSRTQWWAPLRPNSISLHVGQSFVFDQNLYVSLDSLSDGRALMHVMEKSFSFQIVSGLDVFDTVQLQQKLGPPSRLWIYVAGQKQPFSDSLVPAAIVVKPKIEQFSSSP